MATVPVRGGPDVTFLLALSVLLCAGMLGATSDSQRARKLETYLVDKNSLSVSGISSGAYFAVQFHVAFSKTIIGAGILAGGPFWCAQDNLLIAKSACTINPKLISVDELVAITRTTALSLTIDDPSHLKSARVYLFSGTLDSVVVPGVMRKLAEYYSDFVGVSGSIYLEFSIPAAHSMVTDDYGNQCAVLSSPYINNCNYSAAYHLLQQIYGDIKPAPHSMAKPENLLEFDQSEFFLGIPSTVGMDKTGYLYVPTNCQNGTDTCRLHLAFHGCQMGRVFISDTYALHAGYNAIAEVNNIIILYPQAINSTLPFNPKGCWDWWGYTGADYACKLGAQMAGVKLMLDRAAGLE